MRKDAVYRMRVPRKTLAAIKRVAAANGEDASEWGRAIIEAVGVIRFRGRLDHAACLGHVLRHSGRQVRYPAGTLSTQTPWPSLDSLHSVPPLQSCGPTQRAPRLGVSGGPTLRFRHESSTPEMQDSCRSPICRHSAVQA
jgi:hypothetical protein